MINLDLKTLFKNSVKVYLMYSFPILTCIFTAPGIYRETKHMKKIYENAMSINRTLSFYTPERKQQRGLNYANTQKINRSY